MKIEQLYTGCLAEAAYYIESNGEAAIIDPLRDPQPYIDMAEKNGAKIKYVLETHFHADFVSGHLDLAKATGATIVYGPTAQPNFEAHVATDGELLKLGDVLIKVLHTPGHTMESSSYLLIDENGKEHSVYTGDTLFIGDVGRPDLAVKTDLSQEDLAGFLFDSLRNKIMILPDDVIVYPNHGQGSACGKNMSSETFDTLGNQKKTNYALKAEMTKAEFIKEVLTGLVAPPQYFPKNAVMNKMGYDAFESIKAKGLTALSADAFELEMEVENTLVIDTRNQSDFVAGHIPNSLFIGIDDNFAPWVGALVTDLNTRILIVANQGREEEAITRLSRVGYDNAIGFLNGGFDAWQNANKPTNEVNCISAEEFAYAYDRDELAVLDVRKHSEYESQHVQGVENFPLDTLQSHLSELNKHKEYTLHCAGGYRSVIAASILMRNGFDDLVNVLGGFNAIKATGKVRTTAYQAPVTLL